MDPLLASIKATRDTKELQHLNEELCRNAKVLTRNVESIDHAVRNFSFDVKSIGVLHMLAAQAKALPTEELGRTNFRINAMKLLRTGNKGQLFLNPKLLSVVARTCLAVLQAIKASTTPLLAPIMALLASPHAAAAEFTPLHAVAAETALSCKCYREALPLLAEPCCTLADAAKWGTTVDDVLKYHYYAGMLFLGLKRWPDAKEMLVSCLTTPASSLSDIMVEAYKKYIIVSLILHQEVKKLPRYTSIPVTRGLTPKSLPTLQPYTALEAAFRTLSLSDLASATSKHAAVYKEDATFGLVKQLRLYMQAHLLRRMARTFVTVPYAKVADGLGIPGEAVESIVLQMARLSPLHLRLDANRRVVVFKDAPVSAAGDAAALDAMSRRAIAALTMLEAQVSRGIAAAAVRRDTREGRMPGHVEGVDDEVM